MADGAPHENGRNTVTDRLARIEEGQASLREGQERLGDLVKDAISELRKAGEDREQRLRCVEHQCAKFSERFTLFGLVQGGWAILCAAIAGFLGSRN